MPVFKLAAANLIFLAVGYLIGKKVQSSEDAVTIADISIEAARAVQEANNYADCKEA